MQIRPIKSEKEYDAAEELHREVWGAPDIEITPRDLFITAQKNGGVLLAAFDDEADGQPMVGFVFGFVGLSKDGEVKHCSHIACVAEEYRHRQIGYALKLAQRDYVLAQGISLITWTYDPLQSVNARFNLRKLGATCNTYLPNLYLTMNDSINRGLPSDRFQVDWRIDSARVKACVEGSPRHPITLSAQEISAIHVNKPSLCNGFLIPNDDVMPFSGDKILIQFPSNFQEMKSKDIEVAKRWKQHMRHLFESAFQNGYVATDVLSDESETFYLLELNPDLT